MENKHTILNEYTNMEQVLRKNGEQLLKSGGHSASLDETNKYRGQCGQPNNHQVVTKSCNKHHNKYKSKRYEPHQKNRLGTVGNKLPGGLN